MAYKRNIPLATDLISNSQSDLETNFQTIDSGSTGTGPGFARNHVTMTDGTNGGLHSEIDFYLAVTPSPTISGFVSTAYPFDVTVASPSSTNTELFYKNAGRDTQMTSSALLAASGEGFIPGGLQIRSASTTLSSDGQTITFSKPFPTACVSVVVSVANSGNKAATINVVSFNASSFDAFHINISGGNLPVNFTYIAVGY